MDKRYQVFVSSTYEDLREERQEVIQALLELDCIPSGMELFPAADEDQWTLIKKVISECDYYVVISAGRYGSIGPQGQGYTEMEYRYAAEIGKPTIGFLHRDPQLLQAGKVEPSDVGKQKLQAFRQLLQQKMCKYWDSPADLGSVVSRSLVRLMKTTPAVGWIRADEAVDELAAAEVLRLRRRTEELEQRLQDATLAAPPGSDTLAQGEDRYRIAFKFDSVDKKGDRWSWEYAVPVAWNDIFYELGPLMIDEATEDELERRMNTVVEEYSEERRSKDKQLAGHRTYSFEIRERDLETIRIQLRALGLIKRSDKPRSVKDITTYWTLTPYGDRVLTSLRAVAKEDAEPAEEDNRQNEDNAAPI